RDQKKLHEAIAAYKEAIRLKPDYSGAHYNLGLALQIQGNYPDAAAALQKAIHLRRDFPKAYFNLGNVRVAQAKYPEAIAAFAEAVRLQSDYAVAHYNLGSALQEEGRFGEALVALRKGHALGVRQPGWPSAIATAQIRRVERLVELDRDLPAFLAGERKP